MHPAEGWYGSHMTVSRNALNKFRHVADPDDALDMAYDYDRDLDAQYEDYLDWCAEEGTTPLPRNKVVGR